ncbi:hypothetical protein [Methylobacterium haplocladii]|uniref:DUF1508 domain-containing protein n=2 Tax=Methylobacterium haplocladii TaxID=1176176 RepID=A0A512ISB6_9HYPH|nr:hypothetical protein [Methylobacterium haplocladii]GEP00605.1 hypothetical protein MHA02_29920 [Methylobacterium haplocladii]GJD85519.1 hypothetical protein HPGCJGGD_3408 [Methylobacterium haplocladii]GLS57753.1 hypothetical protein GCM10007887_04090 [Methylobacterium haplocladii]
MFEFWENAPGCWRWAFVFRGEQLARAEEDYTSRGKAAAAAEVFARDVDRARKRMDVR